MKNKEMDHWILDNDNNLRLFINDNEKEETYMFIYSYEKKLFFIDVKLENIGQGKLKKLKKYIEHDLNKKTNI